MSGWVSLLIASFGASARELGGETNATSTVATMNARYPVNNREYRKSLFFQGGGSG